MAIFFAPIKTLHWRKYFGETENQRIIFSIETEHTPFPTIEEDKHVDRNNYEIFDIAGQPFAWGKDFVQGKIPYLQPMYLHYKSEQPLQIGKTADAIGLWCVRETGSRQVMLFVRRVAGYMALLLACLYFLTESQEFSIVFQIPAFVYCLSYILRRERMVFFSLATGFFGIVLTIIALGALSTWL